MDLTLDRKQMEFRDEIRSWLESNVPGEKFESVSTVEGLAQHRAWERRLYDAGFAAINWPTAYGGRGMDAIGTAIFYDEYLRAGAPERISRLALGLAGPTLIEEGTDAQRSRWLTNMLTGDDIWCQGFSEPDAGSDLASLRTRGEVSGDSIRVNGQKVWTSHARFANWIFALVRTDPTAPKHRGITFLMIDRHSPGVEVRPINQMNHAADFAEMFFTDVDVPLENVIGQINDGWRVAMRTLTHERSSNLNTAAHFRSLLTEMIELIPQELLSERSVHAQVGRLYEDIEAYRYMTLRTLTSLSEGDEPGAQSMMGKLWWSELQTRIFDFGLSMLGERAELLEDGSGKISTIFQRYWVSRAAQIYAGSNEIQRNIIAERVLGLPKGN